MIHAYVFESIGEVQRITDAWLIEVNEERPHDALRRVPRRGDRTQELRQVLSLAHRRGEISRNPAFRLGEIMRRVVRRAATEVRQTEAWTRDEVPTLLAVARRHDPRFAPLLHFLLATGARRGEALGLKWEDVDARSHHNPPRGRRWRVDDSQERQGEKGRNAGCTGV